MLSPPGARLGRVGANLVAMLSPPGAGSERGTAASLATRLSFAFLITPALMAKGLAFSLFMGLAGGGLPAWRASRIPLTEAMKG